MYDMRYVLYPCEPEVNSSRRLNFHLSFKPIQCVKVYKTYNNKYEDEQYDINNRHLKYFKCLQIT